MTLRHFLLLSLGLAVGGTLAWAGLIWWQRDQPRWAYHWLRDVVVVKTAIARTAAAERGPRVWLVGGSSVWFGFDSVELARLTDRRVINLGLHAELPAPVHAWLLRDHVRAGDIVVIAPELDALVRPAEYTGYAAEEVPLLAPGFLESASLGERGRWLRGVPRPRVLAGVIEKFAPAARRDRLRPEADVRADFAARLAGTFSGGVPSYYNFLEVSAEGDFTRPRAASGHDVSDYALGAHSAPWSADRLAEWAALQRAVRERGARAVFAWQPFENHGASPLDSVSAKVRLAELSAKLRADGWEIAGPPEDAVFTAEKFYDTAYHLTREGATERSQRLARWLNTQPASR